MSSERNDLTQGGILRKLLLVAFPIIGTQVIQMTYNLTDMFWLGRLGSEAVAASGSVGMYMWLSMSFIVLGSIGAQIGVSQNAGRGNMAAAKDIGRSAAQLNLFTGVLYGLALFLLNGLFIGFFNIKEAAVAEAAREYLKIIALGIPFNFFAAASTGIHNGAGNSRSPFFINAIGLVLNMLLDPIMIFTFDMGIKGAAYATVIAQVVVGVLSFFALKKFRGRPFEEFTLFKKPDFSKVKTILKWSAPSGIESFLFCFLTMIISRMVAQWGADAIAAQRVGSQIESLSWLVAGGFCSALTAFVGQNFGAEKFDRIKKCFGLSTVAMIAYGVFIFAVMFFGGGIIFSFFLPGGGEVLAIGVRYTKILAASQVLACFEAVAAGFFRGKGRTVPPSVVSISVNILRVLLAYILSRGALGLTGIWVAVSVGTASRGLLMYLWYALSQDRGLRLSKSRLVDK